MVPIIRSDVLEYLQGLDNDARAELIAEATGAVDPRQAMVDAFTAEPTAPAATGEAMALNSEGIEGALCAALGIGTAVANDRSDFADFL